MTGEAINLVKVEELSRLIREKRKAEDMTLDNVAEITGVSASTLSRLERYHPNGKREIRPDTRTVTSLARWLNLPVEMLLEVETGDKADTLEGHLRAVEAHLRASRNLDAEAMRLLSSIMNLAFEQASKQVETTRQTDEGE
ncbi:MAG: helix-turn-helix transcriptional regulator [Anaerolineae bacterium]|nr:helix-turn-helix transcriptional regulator [Anaerolineae bacterium]